MDYSVKSLKDTLLQTAAVNFYVVFSAILKDIPNKSFFPPGLFENIISKGKELKWHIHPGYLMKCLLHRDVLRWIDIDVSLIPIISRSYKEDYEYMVPLIKPIDYPLRNLSIFVMHLTHETIASICEMSSMIEGLTLQYYERQDYIKFNAIFPKLKRLTLIKYGSSESSILSLDFQSFAENLEILQIKGEVIDSTLINSLKFLTNLKVLSLPYLIGIFCKLTQHALSSSTNLRTLDTEPGSNFEPEWISKMKSLENLSLLERVTSFQEKGLMSLIRSGKVKLKKLALAFHDPISDVEITSLVEKVYYGSFTVDQANDFSTFEPFIKRSGGCIIHILLNLHFIPQHQIPVLEKFIIEAYEINSHTERSLVNKYMESNLYSDDFLKKLLFIKFSKLDIMLQASKHFEIKIWETFINLSGGTYFFHNIRVIRLLLEMVRKDLNKKFTRRILDNFIYISYFYHDRSDDDILSQLYHFSERSIRERHFDKETREGMRSFLIRSRQSR